MVVVGSKLDNGGEEVLNSSHLVEEFNQLQLKAWGEDPKLWQEKARMGSV